MPRNQQYWKPDAFRPSEVSALRTFLSFELRRASVLNTRPIGHRARRRHRATYPTRRRRKRVVCLVLSEYVHKVNSSPFLTLNSNMSRSAGDHAFGMWASPGPALVRRSV